MKKHLYLLLLCLFLNVSLFSNDDLNVSAKIYQKIDEQKIFNIIKKIYREESTEYIIDTTWDKLHIMERSTNAFLTIGMQVDNIILSVVPTEDKNKTQMHLEIFTMIEDEKTLTPPDSLAHKIFWNRIDYALGLDENWLYCDKNFDSILHVAYPYCDIKKDELLP
jgi:hypothetical protein